MEDDLAGHSHRATNALSVSTRLFQAIDSTRVRTI